MVKTNVAEKRGNTSSFAPVNISAKKMHSLKWSFVSAYLLVIDARSPIYGLYVCLCRVNKANCNTYQCYVRSQVRGRRRRRRSLHLEKRSKEKCHLPGHKSWATQAARQSAPSTSAPADNNCLGCCCCCCDDDGVRLRKFTARDLKARSERKSR